MAKLAKYHARALSGGHKELDALVAKAVKLLERVLNLTTMGSAVFTQVGRVRPLSMTCSMCGRVSIQLAPANCCSQPSARRRVQLLQERPGMVMHKWSATGGEYVSGRPVDYRRR